MYAFEPFVPLVLPSGIDPIRMAKANIRGILDSYHGDWDFLIELLQNAVDALDLKFNQTPAVIGKPEIEILINEKAGTIRVSDNGIGMDEEQARLALYPNFTDKPYSRSATDTRSLRGHKGVGITFLAFAFNLLRYCSKKDSVLFSGEISGGRGWVDIEDITDPPKVKPSDYCPEFLEGMSSGTSVEILIGSEFFQRASLNWLGWNYVVRCLTAAGYCDINELFTWNKKAKVTLKLIDMNGVRVHPPEDRKEELPMEYMYPDQLMKCCDLDAYRAKYPNRIEPVKTEQRKYDALFVKWDTDRIEEVLFNKGNLDDQQSAKYGHYLFTRSHIPSVYAMFTHSTRVWKDLLDVDYSNDKRRRFWRAGIQVVTQQMPTGQVQEVSLPYRAGNKDRFFMLIDMPDAKPDYGRKGFKAEISSYVNFIASELIQEYFMRHRVLLKPTRVAHGLTSIDAEAEADSRITQVLMLPELGVEKLSFKKQPQYENDVIALFSELVAREYIRGFEILSVSSGSQYDGVVNYRFTKDREKLIYNSTNNPLGMTKAHLGQRDLLGKNLEFKKSLSDLINEFDEGSKSAQKIRFVVTWDEGDLAGSGIEIINLLDSDNYERREFHGQTHELNMDPDTIPVIMLKSAVGLLFNR